MTRRRLLLADVVRVAIGTTPRLLELRQLSFDRCSALIGRLFAVAMASRAGIYRHVGRQAA